MQAGEKGDHKWSHVGMSQSNAHPSRSESSGALTQVDLNDDISMCSSVYSEFVELEIQEGITGHLHPLALAKEKVFIIVTHRKTSKVTRIQISSLTYESMKQKITVNLNLQEPIKFLYSFEQNYVIYTTENFENGQAYFVLTENDSPPEDNRLIQNVELSAVQQLFGMLTPEYFRAKIFQILDLFN